MSLPTVEKSSWRKAERNWAYSLPDVKTRARSPAANGALPSSRPARTRKRTERQVLFAPVGSEDPYVICGGSVANTPGLVHAASVLSPGNWARPRVKARSPNSGFFISAASVRKSSNSSRVSKPPGSRPAASLAQSAFFPSRVKTIASRSLAHDERGASSTALRHSLSASASFPRSK